MTVLGINSYSCSTEAISGSFERQLVLDTRKKMIKHFFLCWFLSLLKHDIRSGDVITNCSEYLWQHKCTNVVIFRNVGILVPKTHISLSNKFLSYLPWGREIHYSDLIHPTVTIISDASLWIFRSPFTCYTASSTILNGVTRKQLSSTEFSLSHIQCIWKYLNRRDRSCI